MSLPTRKIGTTAVSAIGYGAMGLSSAYGAPLPDEERFKVGFLNSFLPRCYLCLLFLIPVIQVLDAVYNSGCTLWDTADVYKDSEDLIGKW